MLHGVHYKQTAPAGKQVNEGGIFGEEKTDEFAKWASGLGQFCITQIGPGGPLIW